MSLERSVLMPDGTVRTYHTITQITHVVGVETRFDILSTQAGLMDYFQTLSVPYDSSIDENSAYDILASADEFAEYIDPEAEALNTILPILTDEQAGLIPSVWPLWTVDIQYTAGTRVTHNNVVYKCLQDHTSQTDWAPDLASSLWAKCLADSDTISEWEQPDSTNPYMKGDKVTHNGSTWISDVDNNVWEPGVYGWSNA